MRRGQHRVQHFHRSKASLKSNTETYSSRTPVLVLSLIGALLEICISVRGKLTNEASILIIYIGFV
uniref:Ovule protein n=1 Tax=Ascaris lumbricoides TaxID=6252 RepID=A0A0M3IS77_ASCLU